MPPEDFHPRVRPRALPEPCVLPVGLGNDELGYVESITEFRIGCVANLLPREGARAQ